MNSLTGERQSASSLLSSEFLRYLAENGARPGTRLPPIRELAETLGISSGKLREQLEVARELGLVEVRPKTGIRVNHFGFFASIRTAIRFALALNPDHFEHIGALRNQIEAAFWHEAVGQLRSEDTQLLRQLVDRAWEKLEGDPIQIPHSEHRELHLTVFRRLENPFVQGLLEAYWDSYEAVGLDLYEDYTYLREVWSYHLQMVEAIEAGDAEAGFKALVEHITLLQHRGERDGSQQLGVHPNGPYSSSTHTRRDDS